MNETLENKPSGLSGSGLWGWGIFMTALGVGGFAILQNGFLGVSASDNAQLLEKLQEPNMMAMAAVALVLQAICTCAVPVFAFLLVEGFTHTGDFPRYLLRLLGVAVISEIPYNLAMGGSWLVTGSRNPAFGLAMGLILLYFYRHYEGREAGKILIRVLVTLAALVWSAMLRIDEGLPLVVLTAVLWALRKKPTLRLLFGCVAAFACTIFSPFYVMAPFAFLLIHFYNGERGSENRVTRYAAYPALLLVLALAGRFLF